MGALIMSHSDDEGLVLPPKLAPIQVVIVPITGKKEDEKALVLDKAREYFTALKAKGILVKLDDRDGISPGYKFADYELKGVPLRIAIGPRDVAAGNVELARRDTKTKEIISAENLSETISNLLEEIQNSIYNKALEYRNSHIHSVNNWDEFMDAIENKTGFVSAHWDGTGETEEKIKDLSKATIRCVPLNNVQEDGVCVLTGKPSTQRVLFAKAY
jgi:prolyl-tRNA synthetase